MNYSWKIFRYSKYLEFDSDKSSYCNTDIESYSQTIIHSQYDSQNIRKEQWLHLYMESNKFVEVNISNNKLEILLKIHNPPNIKITELENINYKDINLRIILKNRIMAFKYTNCNRKFQITFFNNKEANIFFDKYNELYNGKNNENERSNLDKHDNNGTNKFLFNTQYPRSQGGNNVDCINDNTTSNNNFIMKIHDLVGKVKVHYDFRKSMKTNKSTKELVNEFIRLVEK